MSSRKERKHSNNNARPANHRPVKTLGMSSRLRQATRLSSPNVLGRGQVYKRASSNIEGAPKRSDDGLLIRTLRDVTRRDGL